LLLLPTSASKLLAEWKGPYEIVRRLNAVDYVIRINDHEKTFHVNMIKPFYERKNVNYPVSNSEVLNAVDMAEELYNINPKLSDAQKEAVSNILLDVKDVFCTAPGKIKCKPYEICIDNSVKPIASLPYKIPFALKTKVKEELDRWLDLGIIKPSSSPWCSPVVIVKNADSTLRIAVDFRKINPHVNVDNYPMPNVNTVMEKLVDAKFLTKLDLTKAYFQIPLSELSSAYTSFVTEFGQYEFTVVPFGIRFASGLCNRILNEVLIGCENFVTSFVDDLIVYSSSWDDHVRDLDKIFNVLRSNGITLNLRKCAFAQTTVKFLGYIVGQGEISPDPAKVDALRNFPKPERKKQLRSYLGFLNFYRRFVPNLAQQTAVLTEMLRKTCPDKLAWTNESNNCFKESLSLVSRDVILKIPKPDEPFVVQTDACMHGLGAVLGQIVEDNFEPVCFISRNLSKAERNYSVIELECLSIKWAVGYFHDYLYGNKFVIQTDHAPLTWLRQNKDKNSRLMRWALALQAYDFSIHYIRGCDNFLADMFSRNPVDA
jgi:hypothetical protein